MLKTTLILKDRRLSFRMIAEETRLNKIAAHTIQTDHLHVRKICLGSKKRTGWKFVKRYAGKTRNLAIFFCIKYNRR